MSKRKNSARDAPDEVQDAFRQLAFGKNADALLLLREELPGPDQLKQLDLYNVAAIKRARGVTEIKFYDRLRALEHLARRRPRQEDTRAEDFYDALERGAAGGKGKADGD